MIRFVNLNDNYEFKWAFENSRSTAYRETYTYKDFQKCKLTGVQLIEWLQKYGYTPSEMFENKRIAGFSEVIDDFYNLEKEAEEWLKNNEKNKTWTVVGMNMGFVLLSDGDKENTVELGSASVVNINNSNTNNNDTNISVSARASLI